MAIQSHASNREQEYYRRLAELQTEPLWYLDMLSYSGRRPVAHVWRWKELQPALTASTEVFSFGQGLEDRRALSLINPSRTHGATSTITASMQMIQPGEIARCHRHTLTAVRFIISGHGAYSVVEGEKCPMEAGDLLLTPNWTWHDHGNEGSDPMFWLDGLDSPLVTAMGADIYEEYPDPAQPVRPTVGLPDSVARYGAGGMMPVKRRATTPYSPLNVYKWQVASEALRGLPRSDEDPHDGAIIEYVNPVTGGHVVPTMACYLQLLRRGLHTKAHRHTTNTIYLVVLGSGSTIVDGEEHRWEQNDVLAVPSWRWHEHVASEETVLFSITDLPMCEPLALYREEAYTANGGYQG